MQDETIPSDVVPFGRVHTNFVLRALRKNWLLGAVVLLTVIAATAFYTIGQTKIYRATATIQIDPNPPRPLGNEVQAVVDMGSANYWNNKEYYLTQQKLLQGRSLARETVRTLSLHLDPGFMQGRLVSRHTSKGEMEQAIEGATTALLSRLTVDSIRDSRLMDVSLRDSDPARAKRILAALLDNYLERNVNVVVSSTGAATAWLQDQVVKLKGELERSELALHEYKKDKQILSVTLDDQSNMLRGEMQQLNEALTRTSTRREELLARSRELDKVDTNDPTVLPATELLNNTLLNTLRGEYIRARAALSSLLAEGKGDLHPKVEATRATVETTREALLAEVRNVQGAVRRDLEGATREAHGLSGLFEHAKHRAMDLNMLEIEYRRLERTKTNTEKLYGMVLERAKESDLSGMLRFNNISVVEPPTAPNVPFRPRIPLNLAVGFAVGVSLGLLLMFGKEQLDQTIRSPQDIDVDADVPMLGLLPMVSAHSRSPGYYSRSRRRGLMAAKAAAESATEILVHDAPSSNVAECARSIRTNLTFSSPDKPFRRILVTSGSPSEGKTTIACTIAIAFAQVGQRVLLMDCDLRRPRIHKIMKKPNSTGITTVLQNPSEVDTCIHETQIPNLSLLTAGPHVPNPAELVQSESFCKLLDTLTEKYDRIIIDSPPVLAVTDASVIATRVDTTLLVIRAAKSRRDLLRQTVRKFRELGLPLAGMVMNALDSKQSGYYHYYPYYGYGRKYDTTSADGA